MPPFNSGNTEATARKTSGPEPGATCATLTATSRYCFGTARHTAATIFPAREGAAATAAFAISAALAGSSSAAAPAAIDAMSGTARAIAPTTDVVETGFVRMEDLTTPTVIKPRSRVVAALTISAALAGSSVAGTCESACCKPELLVLSAAQLTEPLTSTSPATK